MPVIDFSKGCHFVNESMSYSGVRKVAGHVQTDILLVTGNEPPKYSIGENCENLIIYGTVGKSYFLDDLEHRGCIDLSAIRGKWEVYGFWIISNPIPGVRQGLVIAGSDKRGTIYGLYHLSELLGVSPFINWNHVWPEKKQVVLTDDINMISNEPSVKYRGFFINDEWPAFGNWSYNHFGGINAKCYEQVFELLLRLKGNYLWPAMWNSNFNLDGPGIESARLADEYGVVMSTSHHEPCMRAGEEFTLFKGKDSPYGEDWNFRTNEEGITRFWRDGLLRNKPYENVITMGMRGERDSAILGKDAGLKANIDLLRDVLATQNKLIRETIDEDLTKVPRQIVLFTEVEEFFYGNEQVKGLMGDPELDGVTLMLSDNNFGYTRTLPSECMRDHEGGYGMYYHMDMHGGAYSYQWIGSTYLPRVWEQMTQAYEFGVKEIWVTNIGDIGTQEFGLSYFLNLAYDIEKWGGTDSSVTEKYTAQWIRQQFGACFEEDQLQMMEHMMWDYTSMLAKRKHEIMNAQIYHPLHFNEAQSILDCSEKLLCQAESLKELCPPEMLSAFIALFYYPICGTANLMKMWIIAGRNELYAKQNRIEANLLVEEIEKCLKEDQRFIREYEEVDNGFYKGFGDSPHIGFTNWNDEDCKYPIKHLIYPAQNPRMLLSRSWDENYMTGEIWCDHPQTWDDFLRPDVNELQFDISNGSDKSFYFDIQTDCHLMHFSKNSGEVKIRERITLCIDKENIQEEQTASFTVYAYRGFDKKECLAKANVKVMLQDTKLSAQIKENKEIADGTYIEANGYICMLAKNYIQKSDVCEGAFEVLSPYGRTGSAVKVFPATANFVYKPDKPYVEYSFVASQNGTYNLEFYLAPTTPVVFEREQYLGFSINQESMKCINTVENPAIPFFLSPQWEREAKDSIKKISCEVICVAGENRLRFYGMSPGIVLEKIVLWPKNEKLPISYLGPLESYRVEHAL